VDFIYSNIKYSFSSYGVALKMKYSISNIVLALGFFSISILPSAFSTLLGGDSIRAGLSLSIAIFFVLAMPFGIRYFITSKIILINVSMLLLTSFFYLSSALILTGVDNIRFLLSLALLFSISFASLAFVRTLDSLKDELFHKMILLGFYFLMCLGYIVLIGIVFFGDERKDMILFTEPSHYAIVFIPFLFYAVYTCNKKPYAILYIIAALVLALIIKNLTLLVGCLMIVLLWYGRRFWSLGLIISMFVVAAFFLDLEYFLGRIDISADNRNLSTLVFLSGWERAYLSFTTSYGFGVGFQQLGIVGPEGDFQIILQGLLDGSGLNVKDGGSLGSKLITETGLLGLILLLFYLFFAYKVVRKFLLREIKGSKNIFFLGVYLLFSIELFVRGMGYFSLTSFLFLSSLYWIYYSRIGVSTLSRT